MKRVLQYAPVIIGLTFLCLLGAYRRADWFAGKNDFVTFYTGAKLAGSPELYSRDANLNSNKAELGVTMDMVYIRPPFYAAFLRPLASLPYLQAYSLFTVFTVASALWFIVRFRRECDALPILASFSIPLLVTFCAGQDSTFLLAFLGSAILLTREKRDFAAGLVLSLCALKFHLFLFIPLLLILKKRWKILKGGFCGGAALMAFGAFVNGPSSILRWIDVMRDPWINPAASGMPNLHGLAAVLGGGSILEVALSAVVCLLFIEMTRRSDNYELLFSASLLCGLLLSYHSTLVDDVLLFPVLVLVLSSSTLVPLRVMAALILSPIPYFLALAGEPYSAVLPVSMLLLLGGMAWSARLPSQPRVNITQVNYVH